MKKIFTPEQIEGFQKKLSTIPAFSGIETSGKHWIIYKLGIDITDVNEMEELKKYVLALK
jgi:hypothetical protein